MTEALEIATFRLKKKHSLEEFVAANKVIDAWLATRAGFRFRRLAVKGNGTLVDVMLWASVADARGAMDHLTQALAAGKVLDMLDMRTLDWELIEIGHGVTGQGASSINTQC
ncbi:hypothetical protein [Ottowia thiooxydans]|uniref:hypothetical protein n=1 Tax=Ottowia thiooxydans TaxID=219182 RepID=UPI0004072AD9|nr:hypothetical protein [Ottowia thiooxydans]